MPTISVIVPVYKAEEYIKRCVNAIQAQTATDWELLLVDDGSPDQSGVLCDALAADDSRVRVIHKEQNGGAAAARNTGMDAATGTYIAFCDSDDAVSPQWLEHLLEAASEDTLPLCSHCRDSDGLGKEKTLSVPSGKRLEAARYYEYNIIGIAGFLWNALYRRDVIEAHHLRLRCQHDKGDYNEDLLFALQYVRYMRHIVYVGYADYWYDAREESLSTSQAAKALYFDKYAEKYALWRAFLIEQEQTESLASLGKTMLYHFLTAMKHKPLKEFRRIVLSEAMQTCVREADTSGEGARVIDWIRKKAVLRLWILNKWQARKG